MKYVRHFRERGPTASDFTALPWSSAAPETLLASDKSTFAESMHTYGPIFLTTSASGTAVGQIGGESLNVVQADAGRDMIEQLLIVANAAAAGAFVTVPRIGLVARGSGTAGAETCYFATVRIGSSIVEIWKRVAGVDSLLASAAFTFTPEYDYYLRFRVSGTTNTLLQAKCWRWDSEEPPTAQTALTLNGTTQKATAGSLTIPVGFTVEAWLKKTTSTGQDSFLSNRNLGSHYIGLASRKAFFYMNTATPAAFNGTVNTPLDTWFHIAFTNDGTTTKCYINGAFSESAAHAMGASTGTVGIGWDPANATEFWDGAIDELRVWSVVRTPAQIADYYKTRALGTEANLLRCWHFDEGTGTNAVDATGNSNATLNDAAAWGVGRVPETQTVSHMDSASPITAAGLTGLVWQATDTTYKGFTRIGFYSAGTSGDAAPMPVSYRKMADWLMNDNTGERVVLMEIDAVGSTNGEASGTAKIPAKIALASAAYVSGPADEPPNQTYEDSLLEVPNFTARASDTLIGRSSLSYGDAIIANENGERDDWLLYSCDGRDCYLMIGGRGWPRWDFFRVLSTTVENIYAPSPGRIGFKLRDGAIKLDRRVQTVTIGGTGPNAGKYVPLTLGKAFNVPLLLLDGALLRYIVNDTGSALGAGSSWPYITDIRNNGASLTKIGTVTAVTPASDQITIVAHGGAIGSIVMFTAGTPPAPLALDTFYQVNSVVSADIVTLKDAFGLIDITGSTTGATAAVQNWLITNVSPGLQPYVQLNANPGGGTLTADIAGSLGSLFGAPAPFVDNVQAAITEIAGRCAVQVETLTYQKLDNMPTTVVGFHGTEDFNGLAAMEEIVSAVGATYAINGMGRLYAAVITLPVTEFDYELFESDIDYDSFKPERTIYPQPVQQLGYKKNYAVQTSGLATSLTPEQAAQYGAEFLFTELSSTTGVDPSAGLDVAANHALSPAPESRETVLYDLADAVVEGTRIATMRSKTLVVFSMNVRAFQIFFQIGERIKITHPRYGFENGEIGIVVGRSQNFLRSDVTLRVVFRRDGRWPTVANADDYVQVDDFYQVTQP